MPVDVGVDVGVNVAVLGRVVVGVAVGAVDCGVGVTVTQNWPAHTALETKVQPPQLPC